MRKGQMNMTNYKVFSKEEERVYDREMNHLLKRIQGGQSLDEACSTIDAADAELRQIIADDVLKIVIAELHYNQGLAFEQVASQLGIAVKRVEDANAIMIEDVMHTINKKNGGLSGGTA